MGGVVVMALVVAYVSVAVIGVLVACLWFADWLLGPMDDLRPAIEPSRQDARWSRVTGGGS